MRPTLVFVQIISVRGFPISRSLDMRTTLTLAAALAFACLVDRAVLGQEPDASGDLTSTTTKEILASGNQLLAEGKFIEAANVFHNATRSPEAATREAMSLALAERFSDAINACDRAIAMAPTSYWGQRALLHKAEVCMQSRNTAAARECVERLRAAFPESILAVQAGILDARLKGQDLQAATAAYEQELTIARQYEQAIKVTDVDERLRLVNELIAQHPNSRTVLKAKASKGHLLWKKRQLQESLSVWQDVMESAVRVSPAAHLADNAMYHVASLYRSLGRPHEAKVYLASLSSKPEFASFAALSLMGLEFEELCKNHAAGKDIRQARAELLAHCRAIMDDSKLTPLTRVKAELRLCETFSWTGEHTQAVGQAYAFVTKYKDSAYRKELLTARHFLGDGLSNLGRWPEALEQYKAILREENAAGSEQLPGVYYRTWQALRAVKAPADQIQAAAEAFLAKFPEHEWANQVRGVQGN